MGCQGGGGGGFVCVSGMFCGGVGGGVWCRLRGCVCVSGVGGIVGVVVKCDSCGVCEEPRFAAYWKEERRPQVLPSLPFFVSSSSVGASMWCVGIPVCGAPVGSGVSESLVAVCGSVWVSVVGV